MMRNTLLLLVLCIALAGCGQTGDLYLPEPATGAPAQNVPDTTKDEDEDDNDEETPAG